MGKLSRLMREVLGDNAHFQSKKKVMQHVSQLCLKNQRKVNFRSLYETIHLRLSDKAKKMPAAAPCDVGGFPTTHQ
jgi:hypothetical protein